MLAPAARQSDVLLGHWRRGLQRLALVSVLAVGGCAGRPIVSLSEAAKSAGDAPASESPSTAASGSPTSEVRLVQHLEAETQGQSLSPTHALLVPSTAPSPEQGLIEQWAPPHGMPAYDATMPTVPPERIPATFAAHMQGPSPDETLPAPAQQPQLNQPQRNPEIVPAPTAQLPGQPLVQPLIESLMQPPGMAPNSQPLTQPSLQPPVGGRWLRLPTGSAGAENVQLSTSSDLVSLTARDAPLDTVLSLIAEQHGLNIVTGADVREQISVKITNARLEDALDAILSTNGYAWTRRNNIIIISKISGDSASSPAAQGRHVQVFTLDYMSATDADKVVQGLLSPVGKSFINVTEPTNHRRTHEQLVVEDLPDYLLRIEQYLMQADTPPRQVQIEAHVLQVTLKDNSRHGVNFQEILRLARTDVTVSTVGLASPTAPTSMIRLQGGDLEALLDALQATTDAKTLASPKVTVLNNQEAHMQVGAKIGYLLSTTTQTSTLQSVNFLDVGVILTVLPSITLDGQVMIKVAPQVSTGRINPTTQLPESETTEVETQVLLSDGEAIVIGGLIKETDIDSRNKVPFLGDLWLVGWLFQKRELVRERNEIIITLVPRIVPDAAGCRVLQPEDVDQATTPLMYGDLRPVDRTRFEAELPCYTVRPRDRKTHVPPYQAPPAQQYVPSYETMHPQEVFEYPATNQPANMPDFSSNLPSELSSPGAFQGFPQQ